MGLFHYTNLNSLACILKNKTIRLNALISVDDAEEGNTKDYGNFDSLVFVSCWTRTEDENIALWHMYSNKASGVRIELDSNCLEYLQENESTEIEEVTNLSTQRYLCLQYGNALHDIIYTGKDDKITPTLSINPEFANGDEVYYYLERIGRFKREVWKFQEESRYIIHLYPKEKDKTYESSVIGNTIKYVQENKNCRNIRKKYIDIPIKDESFNSMKITLGPNQDPGNKEIVEALRRAYNGKLEIKESALTGKIRRKT